MSQQVGRVHHGVPTVSHRQRAQLTTMSVVGAILGIWIMTASFVGNPTSTEFTKLVLSIAPRLTHVNVLSNWPLAIGVWGVVAGAVVTGIIWLAYGRTPKKNQQQLGFATRNEEFSVLGEARVRVQAEQTRPGLTKKQRATAPANEVGLPVGKSKSGKRLYVSLQDHVLCRAPTGAGKTQTWMIPALLSAPGPAIATSTRADIVDVTAMNRASRGFRLWVFDPLNISYWPRPMVWDPVAGCELTERAIARAEAFQAAMPSGTDSTNAGFFKNNAVMALMVLLHAAALNGDSFEKVLSWGLNLDTEYKEPVEIIRNAARTNPLANVLWADQLQSVSTGAPETVSSTRQTLAQALNPLATPDVLRWVTPAEGVPLFDARAFVLSKADLHIICDDNRAQNVSPLCAMLLQEVTDVAKQVAYEQEHSRLDPPLRLVGDELVNIAPLPKMPELITDARAWGFQIIASWQSDDQAEKRWGKQGAATINANMALEVVLPGIKDVPTIERISKLTGQIEIMRSSSTFDSRSGIEGNTSVQLIEKPVLQPDEVRRIDGFGKNQALMLHRNLPPVMVTLDPWYAWPNASELTAERDATRKWRQEFMNKQMNGE